MNLITEMIIILLLATFGARLQLGGNRMLNMSTIDTHTDYNQPIASPVKNDKNNGLNKILNQDWKYGGE